MGVQRVSEKDLIDEYLYRPPSPEQKKKLKKKLAKKPSSSSLSSLFNLQFKFLYIFSNFLLNINIFGRFFICVLVFPCVLCVLSVCVL